MFVYKKMKKFVVLFLFLQNVFLFSQSLSSKDYKIFFKQKKELSVSYSSAKVVFDFLVRVFQKVFSPQDGPTCPFRPVCSLYARRAIAKHGFIKGTILTADRLLRCNPSAKGGKDPVPKKFSIYE